jgi:hypothetical protein
MHVEPVATGTRAACPLAVPAILMVVDTMRLGLRALLFPTTVAARDDAADPPLMPESASGHCGPGGLLLAFVTFCSSAAGPGQSGRSPHRLATTDTLASVILGLLLGYPAVINRRPDVRRVFGYHGAEHQTINAYEAGADSRPPAGRRPDALRCGTSFLLLVVPSRHVPALLGRPDFRAPGDPPPHGAGPRRPAYEVMKLTARSIMFGSPAGSPGRVWRSND